MIPYPHPRITIVYGDQFCPHCLSEMACVWGCQGPREARTNVLEVDFPPEANPM